MQVTHTYMLTEAQTRKLVAVARALTMDRVSYHRDEADGAEVKIMGEDFLSADGQPDPGAAIMDVPDPESLIGAELVASNSHELSEREIAELTEFWPENWAEEHRLRHSRTDE